MPNPLNITQRSPKNAKILIIDDQPMNIEILTGCLHEHYQTFTSNSGAEGLELAKKIVPDLILLDVVMDGMDGIEVCLHIKEDEHLKDIPVLFVTSLESRADEENCWKAGASDFILKPINAQTLNHRVRTHLTIKLQTEFLQKMVYLDGLTGVFNRRYFDMQLPVYRQQQNRSNTPLSLLMVDVDHFKQFNDTYGHLVGDECLKYVASTLKQCLHRPLDIVTRYGGEEFAILLSDTNKSGATYLAEEILCKIRNPNCKLINGGVCEKNKLPCSITVSIGIATCEPHSAIKDHDFIQLADNALYKAKDAGRNRYCLAPSTPDSLIQSSA